MKEYRDFGRSLYSWKIAQEITDEYDKWLKETDRHFISIPGILAFFYYPGSYWFLFAAMLILGAVGAGFEIATYKWAGSNVILCSLIAFVVVFRYMHFGYVPVRSYLLFGAVAMNIILIHFLNRILAHRYAKD